MSHSAPALHDGHEVRLLQGSEAYFPALIEAVDAASREVWLETYIIDFTAGAGAVAEALIRAAQRGVRVRLVIDGVGTPNPDAAWRRRFDEAGVQWRIYSPMTGFAMFIPKRWRRMHRKLCLVDGRLAFCGGINILDDYHDPNFGTLGAPRFDFAVQVRGPLCAQVRDTMQRLWQRVDTAREVHRLHYAAALQSHAGSPSEPHGASAPLPGSAGADDGNPHTVRAALVLRDNLRNRSRIEKAYLKAIGTAREEIIIANAYFVPGSKLRRALVLAARRGVRVRLLLQGKYEYFMQYYSSRPVYGALLAAGVEIYEYAPSFLHAKVAVVDRRWCTVGSSNLDPLSFLMAREANIVLEDEAFAEDLRARLLRAMQGERQRMDAEAYARRPLRERALEQVALVTMRLALFIQGKRY